jgi:hypothetical protein
MKLWPHLAITAALVLATTIASRAVPDDAAAVAYPADYREWVHVKSMLIRPDHPLADPFAGIHHI